MKASTTSGANATSVDRHRSCSFSPAPCRLLQFSPALPSCSGVVRSFAARRRIFTKGESCFRSCSTLGKPISCHDPVSGHCEFLSRKRRSFRTAPCADAPQVMYSRTQVQILAMFSSLRGISWPSRIQQALSICKLANLDLVRGTASTQHCNCRAPPETDSSGIAAGSSSFGLQSSRANQVLYVQLSHFCVACDVPMQRSRLSRTPLGRKAGSALRVAEAQGSRLFRQPSAVKYTLR